MPNNSTYAGGYSLPILSTLANRLRTDRDEQGNITGYRAASPFFSSLVGGGWANQQAGNLNARLQAQKQASEFLKLKDQLERGMFAFQEQEKRKTKEAEQAGERKSDVAKYDQAYKLAQQQAEVAVAEKLGITPEELSPEIRASLGQRASVVADGMMYDAMSDKAKSKERVDAYSTPAGQLAIRNQVFAELAKEPLANSKMESDIAMQQAQTIDTLSQARNRAVSVGNTAFRFNPDDTVNSLEGGQKAGDPTFGGIDQETGQVIMTPGAPATRGFMGTMDNQGMFIPPQAVTDSLGGAGGVFVPGVSTPAPQGQEQPSAGEQLASGFGRGNPELARSQLRGEMAKRAGLQQAASGVEQPLQPVLDLGGQGIPVGPGYQEPNQGYQFPAGYQPDVEGLYNALSNAGISSPFTPVGQPIAVDPSMLGLMSQSVDIPMAEVEPPTTGATGSFETPNWSGSVGSNNRFFAPAASPLTNEIRRRLMLNKTNSIPWTNF